MYFSLLTTLVIGAISFVLFLVYIILWYSKKVNSKVSYFGYAIGGVTLIVMIISQSAKKVYIIEGGNDYKEYYAFGNTLNFKFSNNNSSSLNIENNLIINNTIWNLTYETIEYGNELQIFASGKIKERIPPLSSLNVKTEDQYFFTSPPSVIQTDGQKETRGWVYFQ